jgi:GNAT superfamily N-acetyltransferase
VLRPRRPEDPRPGPEPASRSRASPLEGVADPSGAPFALTAFRWPTGEPIGGAELTFEPDSGTLRVDGWVTRRFRGRGYGRGLIELIARFARAGGIRQIRIRAPSGDAASACMLRAAGFSRAPPCGVSSRSDPGSARGHEWVRRLGTTEPEPARAMI